MIEEETMRVLLGGAGGQTSRECLLGQGTGGKAVGVTGESKERRGGRDQPAQRGGISASLENSPSKRGL